MGNVRKEFGTLIKVELYKKRPQTPSIYNSKYQAVNEKGWKSSRIKDTWRGVWQWVKQIVMGSSKFSYVYYLTKNVSVGLNVFSSQMLLIFMLSSSFDPLAKSYIQTYWSRKIYNGKTWITL